MIRFGEMHLTNIVYYPSASFNFGQQGISYITGVNENGSVEDYRNGTGKSLLIQALSHLKFPDSLGNTRAKNYGALFSSTSEITWHYSVGNAAYQVTERGSGKRYEVLLDGDDQKPRTPTIAQSVIDRSIDLTEEEFYTYVYLDSRRNSVFQSGTPATRHSYFTNLFRLNEIDVIGAQLRKYQGVLAGTQRERDLRADDLAALGSIADVDSLESAIRSARRRLAKTARLVKADSNLVEDKRLAERYGADLEKAKDHDEKAWRRARALDEQWRDYTAALRAQRSNARLLGRNQDILREGNEVLGTSYGYTPEGVRDFNAMALQRRRQADAAIREWDRADEDWRDARVRLRELADARTQAKALAGGIVKTRSVDAITAEIEQLEDQNEHLLNHRDGGICDTCGHVLDPKQARKRSKENEGRIESLRTELDTARDSANAQSRMDRLWNPDREAEATDLKKVRKPSGERPAELQIGSIDFIEEIEARKPSGSAEDASLGLSRLDAARDAHGKTEAIRDRIERGLKIDDDQIAAAERRAARAERLRDEVYRLERDLGSAEEKQATAKRYTREIRNLDRQLVERKLIDDLAEVYSPRGAKIAAMRKLTDAITENLNRYSPLLFIEPFEFSITVDTNLFDVIVTRPDGKTSDVRRLSGAEARQFALLWMISVIREIPADRRVNVAILDEFEAGMSPAARKLLMETYLPELVKVVDHVVFISPNAVAPDPDGRYRVYEVRKQGAVSQINLKEI